MSWGNVLDLYYIRCRNGRSEGVPGRPYNNRISLPNLAAHFYACCVFRDVMQTASTARLCVLSLVVRSMNNGVGAGPGTVDSSQPDP